MELGEKLLNKSIEAFIVAIEIYNKPTLKYRVEGFSFFICNAWELLLKAYIIRTKSEREIYYRNDKNRTINLENCIKKVFTNNKDPLRVNLESIIPLRNTSTHFITEEYELIYIPLFQACVINFTDKLLAFFNKDIADYINSNFITLSTKFTSIDETTIKAKYPFQISSKLLSNYHHIQSLCLMGQTVNPKLAIPVVHELYLTKKPGASTPTFSIAKDAKDAVFLAKSPPKDMLLTCPHTVKKCIEIINAKLKKDGVNFINPVEGVTAEKKNSFNKAHFDLFNKFYNIKSDPKFCYQYKVGQNTSNTYSNHTIDFILQEIKNNPENIIQDLKTALLKKES